MNKHEKYEKYLPYATPRQREIFDSVQQHGTNKAAAEALGINPSCVTVALQTMESRALSRGFDAANGLTDPSIYATSTLVKGGPEDPYQLKWIKAKTDKEQREDQVLHVLESFAYTPAPPIEPPKTAALPELATLYTITDFHLGMYAWKQETGDDWDTNIAGKVMLNAVRDMAAKSPDSEVGILNIQGDFLHWDGLDAVTPSSGHILDADTRFDRMIELAIDLNVWAIEELLKKHNTVEVIICEGNHDLAGSAWLRKTLKKIMANNDRVNIDDTPVPFYAYLHGDIMLGFHHGHKRPNKSLPMLFSSEPRYREMWGASTYTYIHTGHYHHKETDSHENGGAIVERHQTLAGRDAYAARGGWISQRSAQAITYHKTMGEVERVRVLPREE